MTKKEHWKDIADIYSEYQISSHGNVRKVLTNAKGKIVYKPVKVCERNDTGGRVVNLRNVDGHGHNAVFSVPLLVAEHFLSKTKPQGAWAVKTIDGNYPCVDNIEWIKPTGKRKKNSRFLLLVKGKEVGMYNSLRELCLKNKLSYDLMSKIFKGVVRSKEYKIKTI